MVVKESGSRPISRVLSWTIIHLGLLSPASSSDLPEDIAGRDIVFLFGLAPGGVYHATSCYQLRGALLPHHFTLTCPTITSDGRRYLFCCTFRRLKPPRNYLAPCPVEPGLSSFSPKAKTRLPGRLPRLLSTTCNRNGRVGYVQDERYIAMEHMDKVRPGTGREGSLGCVRRDGFRYARFCACKSWVTSYPPYESLKRRV